MNVIYIDDDATNRAVLSGMLDLAGVSLVEAEDAETGLRKIDEGRFDLAVMDLRMPGMNGLTAIRRLRARETGRRLPVLVVTADLTPGVRELCVAAGADGFMEKPVALNRFFDAAGSAMVGAGGAVI
jgi:CheY-like chemotaxis protein